ncbi:MAG TPA: DUF2075 domain-containing protein [Saprospiraceae bacterium]|nr:DUF2075 domain-containing protein [Saprospiraceae bacterium]
MQLSPHQNQAFEKIKQFIQNSQQDVFVLKGYAGTGKTTLVKFLLDWMNGHCDYRPVLLASTGRAAKVLQSKAKFDAFTVHSHIYSFDVLEEKHLQKNTKTSGQLTLNFKLKTPADSEQKTLYVVDEASMLSHLDNKQNTLTRFGSGNLLADFFRFVGTNKILFVGDPVQLPPPVGRNPFSSALSPDFLEKHFHKKVRSFELKEIMRQREGHAILDLASKLREVVMAKSNPDWEVLMKMEGRFIYRHFTQQIMINQFLKLVGPNWDKAIILTHSNKQAYFLNMSIRRTIFKKEPPMHLIVNELLMVSQNSYYVPLSNGDQVIVRKIRPAGKRAGFRFLEVEVEAVHNKEIYKTLLLADFLFRPEANLDPEKQKYLLIDFDKRARNNGWSRNSKEYKNAMRNDKYLNALRAKFGYAITCHKAQGGEWPNVFINLSETLNMLASETRFRWLYTAVTRAQDSLNLKPVWKKNKSAKRNFR